MPPSPGQLDLKWLSIILTCSALALVAGILLIGGDIGVEIAGAACSVAAGVGIHSPVPSPLRGKPHIATLIATICGALAVKVYGHMGALPPAEHVQIFSAWAVIFICCFVAGKPLTVRFDANGDPVQEQAPAPAPLQPADDDDVTPVVR